MSGASTLRGGRTRKFKAEINVVPYIDVMLVLLIIFMVAAPITNPSVINLPTAGKSSLPPTAYIEVSLNPDTRATIALKGPAAGKAESFPNRDALIQRLRSLHEENAELPVMISADKEIKYDDVIQIISESKKLGITRVGLATK
jgi:biopolymer transport protein TolR